MGEEKRPTEQSERLGDHLATMLGRYSNNSVPLKIRKIELMRECGLDVPETLYVERKEILQLPAILNDLFKANPDQPRVLRVACIPNRHTTPVVYVDTAAEIVSGVAKAREIVAGDTTVTHIMVRPYSGQSNIGRRIVGRFTLLSEWSVPNDEVLEFYAGAKSASIFERVEAHDPKSVRIVKRVGEFPRNESRNQYPGCAQDYVTISGLLTDRREKMEQVRTILAAKRGVKTNAMEVCFEFYVLGERITFADFD